eukprot:5443690-Amphidinium_carterae.1
MKQSIYKRADPQTRAVSWTGDHLRGVMTSCTYRIITSIRHFHRMRTTTAYWMTAVQAHMCPHMLRTRHAASVVSLWSLSFFARLLGVEGVVCVCHNKWTWIPSRDAE